MIFEGSEMEKGPFDSIYKLEAIVKKGGTPSNIRWLIGGVIDAVKYQGTPLSDIACRQLTGRGMPGGCGLLDLVLGRRELAEALMAKAKESMMMKLDAGFVKQIDEFLTCHTIYRTLVSDNPTWIGSQPHASQSLLALMEDILFGKKWMSPSRSRSFLTQSAASSRRSRWQARSWSWKH